MRWWRFAIQTADAKAGILQRMAKCGPRNGRCRKRLVADTAEQVNLLVVEPGENAALCLLAQLRGDSRPNHAAWRCD